MAQPKQEVVHFIQSCASGDFCVSCSLCDSVAACTGSHNLVWPRCHPCFHLFSREKLIREGMVLYDGLTNNVPMSYARALALVGTMFIKKKRFFSEGMRTTHAKTVTCDLLYKNKSSDEKRGMQDTLCDVVHVVIKRHHSVDR